MRILLSILFLFCISVAAQTDVRIMSYNLLNYPGSTAATRNPYFRTIMDAVQPDILVVQEVTSQAAVDGFLTNVLNFSSSNYSAGTFIDGYDSDNAIFYKTTSFTFHGNTAHNTALRDINEFKISHKITKDTLLIYSVHLKASSGGSNESLRNTEVGVLRSVTDALHEEANFIVVGDFNIYSSNESAYGSLLNQTNSGYFIDDIYMSGTWNNSSFAQYHTQSTRTTQFGGGATGGLDDRFDMILYSQTVKEQGGIKYTANSMTPYGNDGNHYNMAINDLPNTAVTSDIANALHGASDHLPVFANFEFWGIVPVELIAFSAEVLENSVLLYWSTATEVNNYGFSIERKSEVVNREWEVIGFVEGHGNSNSPKEYIFVDVDNLSGEISYRLKQIDTDGSFEYSDIITVELNLPKEFTLRQNYPNPFNPSTVISYSLPKSGKVQLKVFDLLGREVATLVNKQQQAGNYEVTFNASKITSGIYFYRLQSGGFVESKKLVLLR